MLRLVAPLKTLAYLGLDGPIGFLLFPLIISIAPYNYLALHPLPFVLLNNNPTFAFNDPPTWASLKCINKIQSELSLCHAHALDT